MLPRSLNRGILTASWPSRCVHVTLPWHCFHRTSWPAAAAQGFLLLFSRAFQKKAAKRDRVEVALGMDKAKLFTDIATKTAGYISNFLLLERKKEIYYTDVHRDTQVPFCQSLMLVPPILAEYIPEKQH